MSLPNSNSLSIYQAVTESILAALAKGTVPWRKPWTTNATLPVNAVSRRAYRGVNVFLLGLSPYSDHRWVTLKQANELGGKVKRNERATFVVFWKQWEVPQSDEETRRKTIPLLRRYWLFNAEQCEGLHLPALEVPRTLNRIDNAELAVKSMPYPPTIREGGSAAFYRPFDDLVQVPEFSSFMNPDSYYGTLFHELGHATGHPSRLARAGVADQVQFGSESYCREELVAELCSAFCCATLSLDNSLINDAASYIQGWMSVLKSDPKAVVIAAAQAQRAADYILNIPH